MGLRASDPAGHHGLDIMDGVDGGCAVGGGPVFVGIPPYLARQAQVPFPDEVKNCANLRACLPGRWSPDATAGTISQKSHSDWFQ